MKTLRLQRKKFLSAKRVPHTTNHCPWRCLAAKMFSKNSKIQMVANPKLKTLNNCWMDLGYFWMLLICQGPGFSSLKSCSCEALPVLQKHTHFLWDFGRKIGQTSLVLKHQNLTSRLISSKSLTFDGGNTLRPARLNPYSLNQNAVRTNVCGL